MSEKDTFISVYYSFNPGRPAPTCLKIVDWDVKNQINQPVPLINWINVLCTNGFSFWFDALNVGVRMIHCMLIGVGGYTFKKNVFLFLKIVFV